MDLVEFYEGRPGGKDLAKEMSFYKSVCGDLGYPFQTDLIVCNPPWIPASLVSEMSPLDNASYDPDEQFLKSSFNFSRIHLSKAGEMLLLYSDLAHQLGLQEENRVPNLANEFGLRAELLD